MKRSPENQVVGKRFGHTSGKTVLRYRRTIKDKKGKTITLEISPLMLFIIISQLQLALRHPENKGPSRREVERVIKEVRGRIALPGDPIDTLINMGFDERFDRDA